jgi:hypothetical protein
MEVTKEFEGGNYGFDKINRSYIFLLPKMQGVERFSDFRPIALEFHLFGGEQNFGK